MDINPIHRLHGYPCEPHDGWTTVIAELLARGCFGKMTSAFYGNGDFGHFGGGVVLLHFCGDYDVSEHVLCYAVGGSIRTSWRAAGSGGSGV